METTITKSPSKAKDYPYEGTVRDYLDPLGRNRRPASQLKPLIRKEELAPQKHVPFGVDRLLD
jgi:hypothetical protein